MNAIKRLEERLAKAKGLRSERANVSHEISFAHNLAIDSIDSHIADLEHQLRVAKTEREKEVLELRLSGDATSLGSISLGLFGDIAKYLTNALHSSSVRLETGREPRGRIPGKVVRDLNLRFSDIATGSTRLFVTADTSPDLFGRSLTEDALETLFELVLAETEDSLGEAAHKFGGRGTRNLLELLRRVDGELLEVDLHWRSPQGVERRWSANRELLHQLITSLASLSEQEPERIIIKGQVVLLSDRGRIDIRETEALLYRCSFPRTLLESIQRLHIGQSVTVHLLQTIIINELTGVEKTNYDVLEISPVEAAT